MYLPRGRLVNEYVPLARTVVVVKSVSLASSVPIVPASLYSLIVTVGRVEFQSVSSAVRPLPVMSRYFLPVIEVVGGGVVLPSQLASSESVTLLPPPTGGVPITEAVLV